LAEFPSDSPLNRIGKEGRARKGELGEERDWKGGRGGIGLHGKGYGEEVSPSDKPSVSP